MSDGELVRRALDGRFDARDELVRRWAARVLACCHAHVRCRQTAEDLAQESLLRAFRALASLEDPEKFGAWLRGIAQRVCLDWHKSKVSRQATFTSLAPEQDPADLASVDEGPEQIFDRAEQQRRLLSAVDELPDECREVIMLYYYQDVTYRDLAQQLGTSAATVNARLTKARALLRERLSGLRRS
jgi:RNA polymerase sigma-70 factor (ECF subfamily)